MRPPQLSAGTPSPFGFTGEPTDPNGMVYLLARYYVPGIGAFGSLDPLMGANRYGYVGGNPVMWVDPDGRKALAVEPTKKRPPTQPPKPQKPGQQPQPVSVTVSPTDQRGSGNPNPPTPDKIDGIEAGSCSCGSLESGMMPNIISGRQYGCKPIQGGKATACPSQLQRIYQAAALVDFVNSFAKRLEEDRKRREAEKKLREWEQKVSDLADMWVQVQLESSRQLVKDTRNLIATIGAYAGTLSTATGAGSLVLYIVGGALTLVAPPLAAPVFVAAALVGTISAGFGVVSVGSNLILGKPFVECVLVPAGYIFLDWGLGQMAKGAVPIVEAVARSFKFTNSEIALFYDLTISSNKCQN